MGKISIDRLGGFVISFVAVIFMIYFQFSSLPLFLVSLLGFFFILYNRVDYRRIEFSFIAPWCVLLLFSELNLTYYYRNISPETAYLISVPILSGIILSSFSRRKGALYEPLPEKVKTSRLNFFLFLLYALFSLNFIWSGFIPLVSQFVSGYSNYKDFGVSSLNGFINSFALSLCVILFYFRKQNERFKIHIYIIVFVFIATFTRQNIITIFLELLVIKSLGTQSKNLTKISVVLFFALVIFAFLGELRSGDIKELIHVRPEYNFLPSMFYWVYSYSYFNVLNLDNLITSGYVGLNNGYAFSTLIPSVFRGVGGNEVELVLDLDNLNVSSYLMPIVQDWGVGFSILFTFFVFAVAVLIQSSMLKKPSFLTVSCFSVLYFCSIFSFFVNFWLYLPVIFQLVFFVFFRFFLVRRETC
ncbi:MULTISPECIES: O-antigen polymerase [Pectobacterium]|uniref:O-antigen polymerase n=1 Tax=Pectobacterium TaxID=122277 RepID=UPI0018DAD91C|nr:MULTISPECIES: O-antigen polymerase [Pectobacterium]QPI41856.1 oligosaccharide repeat unit polymerase [Pectobacterium aroidearum]